MEPGFSDRFNHFFDLLVAIEGGDCTDTGGRTRYGISKNAYPDVDIPNLTLEGAKEIYHADFYMPLHCDEITDDHFAFQFFCAAVNIGVGDAKKHIWNVLGLPLTSTIVGAVTLGDLNKKLMADKDGLYSVFLESLVDHYFDLATRNTKYQPYLRGWIHRLCRAINL
jgi:lysozyme family protein